ncbi:MAG: 50S ribosome-binding GTPase [Moraxellaceae bacterium]|nr:50S ribosome-binding GTPase [Moraxellaceae bacterium]
MNIQIKELFATYEKTKTMVAEQGHMQQSFSVIQNIFEDKKNKPDANIMVYGVYNAGKSTLINALIGNEVAATGDIPLTDKVTEYPCRNYMILDTPGIDAPKEHENVTKEQLEKADAVVFVVNPLGVVEEAKTLAALMDLFENRKKVFLVFNEKNQLTEEDFIQLKNQTRERLQELADERHLKNILKDIPIIKMNAQMALMGKLKDKEKLVEISGCFEFEKQLDKFIESISQEDIYIRLKSNLDLFLTENIKMIEAQSNNEIVKQYDKLISDLSKDKLDTRKFFSKRIEGNEKELYVNIKSWIYNEIENIEMNIEHWILDKSKLIETELNDALMTSSVKIQDDIEQLQAKIPTVCLDGLPNDIKKVQVDSLDQDNYTHTASTNDQGIKINKEQLGQFAASMSKNIKTEHVVAGLNLVKQYLPNLMKGVGQKTIEKWAGQIVGKAVPIAGMAVTMGLALHDILSDDPETEQLKRRQEIEQKARERRDQQIEDSALQIADQFATSLAIAINSVIDDFFNKIVHDIRQISVEFGTQDQINSKILDQILKLQQELS